MEQARTALLHSGVVNSCRHIVCLSCQSRACTQCITELHLFLSRAPAVRSLLHHDPAFLSLTDLKPAAEFCRQSVQQCPSCSFKATISTKTNSGFKMANLSPGRNSPTVSRADTKRKFPMDSQKATKKQLRSSSSMDTLSLSFLDNYFSPSSPVTPYRISPSKIRLKLRSKKAKSQGPRNLIQGCLVFPLYDFAILGDCSNQHVFFDHHALAGSKFGNQVPVLHGVPSTASAANASKYIQWNNIKLKSLGAELLAILLYLFYCCCICTHCMSTVFP